MEPNSGHKTTHNAGRGGVPCDIVRVCDILARPSCGCELGF